MRLITIGLAAALAVAALPGHCLVRELQEVTAFFNSPIGQRLVQHQTSIIAESSAIGQRWGARIGEEIARTMIK
jgi:hypothetical protein